MRICISHRGRVFSIFVELSSALHSPHLNHWVWCEKAHEVLFLTSSSRALIAHRAKGVLLLFYCRTNRIHTALYICFGPLCHIFASSQAKKTLCCFMLRYKIIKKFLLSNWKLWNLCSLAVVFCRKKSYRVVRCKVFFFCISFPPHCKMQETTIFLYCVVSCFVSLEVFNLIVRHRLFSAFNLN